MEGAKENRAMRRFFIKLLIFTAIIVGIDVGYGLYCDHIRRGVQSGMTRLDYIAAYETRADVLVFGSSRARRHYDTRILRDSLGMSCFNCGYNSMGIGFFKFRLKQILDRYTPKLIIYDITPMYDLMVSDARKVNNLRMKPYFFDDTAYAMVRRNDFKEWIKYHSATYRYHDAIKDYKADSRSKETFYDGYAPLNGTQKIEVKRHAGMTPDPAKARLLEELMSVCLQRGVKLVFVLSPYYCNDMADPADDLRKLSARYGVPVIDHFCDSRFISDSTLYWDAAHMNSEGAARFTRCIISEIKASVRL